jgi:hypothetical protein
MRAFRRFTWILAIVLLTLTTLTTCQAETQSSIPINGRYSIITINIYIPPYPTWAHDVVLNAAIIWNRAQLWNLQNNPSPIFYFLETNQGMATSIVSFSMPAEYAAIAVGWTNYKFAPGSSTRIVSTTTYLSPSIFNAAQENNMTARRYALWLALHELGRILGLGDILDGHDIMDPFYTPQRISQVPEISTLDLYALHILAEGNTPYFVTLPFGIQDLLTAVTFFLP